MVQAFGRMSHVASVEPKQSQALYPFQVAPARSAAGVRSGLFTIAPSFALPSAAPQETGSILECALLKVSARPSPLPRVAGPDPARGIAQR
jgi:hypothetical protein